MGINTCVSEGNPRESIVKSIACHLGAERKAVQVILHDRSNNVTLDEGVSLQDMLIGSSYSDICSISNLAFIDHIATISDYDRWRCVATVRLLMKVPWPFSVAFPGYAGVVTPGNGRVSTC